MHSTPASGRPRTADLLFPLVDVLLLHGPEPEDEVEPALSDLRRRSPTTEISYHSADYGAAQRLGVRAFEARARDLYLLAGP